MMRCGYLEYIFCILQKHDRMSLIQKVESQKIEFKIIQIWKLVIESVSNGLKYFKPPIQLQIHKLIHIKYTDKHY